MQEITKRVDPWIFAAAAATALVIALLTVLTQSILVARARPVMALRYE
jgi:putative ABC transport system permease protein